MTVLTAISTPAVADQINTEHGKGKHNMKLTGNRCRCSGCGEHFNSASAFDRHRTGTYGTSRHSGTRRCLTVPEMQARGWLKNGAEFWVMGKRPPNAVTSRVETAITPTPLHG
jgi:hypothetical protein